jgi:glutathione synthase/RimK-type ligase-like ATP-grasp enzyme
VGRVPGEAFTAVWFRRPQKPQQFARARKCDEPYLAMEWSHFHENVYALSGEFGETLWANYPASAYRTENKLVQLHVARACGMLIPETLVSTDPRESARFISQHGRVIYKSFRTYLWIDRMSGRRFTNWARLIDSNTRLSSASLELCPGIFQRYVEKARELRVTVIGNHQFVAQIRSSRGSGLVDSRQSSATWSHAGASGEVQASSAVLSADWRAKIQRMMRKLKIVFGCIDLAVDAKGDIYFLEVNQSGDFLFVEQMLESLPVLRAMCAMLAAGRADYSLESMGNVSFRDYLRSGAHLEWVNGLEPEPAREIRSKWTMLE